ncbi:MAG: MFS transporter [Burkholderiaceae bacterium]|jgi:PPP family 3-phenylpropionic acid transporter|nr:MFS transporter [Burkholderiaceae bacterium]
MRGCAKDDTGYLPLNVEKPPARADAWPGQSWGFGTFFFSYYGFVGIFPPYVTLFFAYRGMSAVDIGILMSIAQAMRIVGPNLWGWIADVWQKRTRVLQLVAVLSCLSFIGIFFGTTFLQFAVIMIVLNLFTSGQGPLSDAIMLAEMRGNLTRYGQLRLWGSIGYIVMTASVGWFLDQYGIVWMPWVGLLVLGVVCLISFFLYDTPQSAPVREDIPFIRLLCRKDVLAFLVSAFFMLAAHSALYAFYSLYLRKLGYSHVMVGIMWALGATAEILFFIYQSSVFRRFGLKWVMIASLALAVVRFLLIGCGGESFLILLFAQILHAATFGAHHSASILTLQRWFSGARQARGQAMFISVSYGLGCTLGGLFLSFVWGWWGAETVYLIASGFALLGLLAAIFSYRWQNGTLA